MKPTSPNVDKESVSWSLSWHPEGRCDSFTKEAILAYAPPISGVYGLFNFDCQLFIGESANIQEALLRHEIETDFQSQHLRPKGFTFEPCAEELRKTKAAELIARFRPVLQAEAVLSEAHSRKNHPMRGETSQDTAAKTGDDHQEFPAHEREERGNVRRSFRFKRRHALSAALLSATALAIFYLGMPADYTVQKQASGANPTPGQAESSAKPQNVSSGNSTAQLANQKTDRTAAKPEMHASVSTANNRVPVADKNASATTGAGAQAKASPTAPTAASNDATKKWSVQISAAPAKDIADGLTQQLKAKGYDGYVIKAEVKGQTYYRVRVGHFNTQEQAESVRQSLARQEGYPEAYLTGD